MEVVFAEGAEDPRRVVLELEIIFRRRGKFVPDDIEREFVPCCEVFVAYRAFNFSLATRNLERRIKLSVGRMTRKRRRRTPIRIPVNILYIST